MDHGQGRYSTGPGRYFDGEEIIYDIITHTTSAKVRISCKNEGRTPAWITEVLACVDVVDSLPSVPDFKSAEMVQNEPEYLAAGQEYQLKDKALSSKKGREIGKLTVVYGIVKYRNVISETDGTTTFGYKICDDGALERLSSPRAYNDNT